MDHLDPLLQLIFLLHFPAIIVRFLTKRFIGDYEPNTGKLYSRLVCVEGDQLSLQIQDTPGGIQVRTAKRVWRAAAYSIEMIGSRS